MVFRTVLSGTGQVERLRSAAPESGATSSRAALERHVTLNPRGPDAQ